MDAKPLTELNRVRQWAHDKIQAGSEPPWAWYQYMKLIEAIDAIKDGMAATTTENSPPLVERSGKLIQLKAAKYSQDSAQQHRDSAKIPMPM